MLHATLPELAVAVNCRLVVSWIEVAFGEIETTIGAGGELPWFEPGGAPPAPQDDNATLHASRISNDRRVVGFMYVPKCKIRGNRDDCPKPTKGYARIL